MNGNLAPWALGVSLGSVLLSALALHVSSSQAERALQDNRQALLMSERIDACLVFYDAGVRVEEASRAAHYMRDGPARLSEREIANLDSHLHEALMESYTAKRRVDLLGPDILTQQSSAVTDTASRLSDAVSNKEEFEEVHADLENALVAFFASCSVVGTDFRANNPTIAQRIRQINERVRGLRRNEESRDR